MLWTLSTLHHQMAALCDPGGSCQTKPRPVDRKTRLDKQPVSWSRPRLFPMLSPSTPSACHQRLALLDGCRAWSFKAPPSRKLPSNMICPCPLPACRNARAAACTGAVPLSHVTVVVRCLNLAVLLPLPLPFSALGPFVDGSRKPEDALGYTAPDWLHASARQDTYWTGTCEGSLPLRGAAPGLRAGGVGDDLPTSQS